MNFLPTVCYSYGNVAGKKKRRKKQGFVSSVTIFLRIREKERINNIRKYIQLLNAMEGTISYGKQLGYYLVHVVLI